MFFPLILRLVELQRYGYKPMLSPQRDPSKGYLSDPCKHYFRNPCMGNEQTLARVPYPTHKRILSSPLLALQHE